MIISMSVCCGNFKSEWILEGLYDFFPPILFIKLNIDAFIFEYDSERTGSFETLQYIHGKAFVVLGIVTTKSGELENEEVAKQRYEETSKYVPKDRFLFQHNVVLHQQKKDISSMNKIGGRK